MANLLLCRNDASQNFNLALLKYEANIIAAAQSVHSVPDILAHVLYYILNMSKPKIDEINIKNISCKIPDSIFKENLGSLQSSAEYKYLLAFVNTTKHRRIVPTRYAVPLFTNQHGLVFQNFVHKDLPCAEKTADSFLEEIVSLMNQFVCLGNSLNELLFVESRYKANP